MTATTDAWEEYINSDVHVNLCKDDGETDPQVGDSKGKRAHRFFDQPHRLISQWKTTWICVLKL